MLNFRNGYKNWKVQIRTSDNGIIEELTFPRANEAGQPEDHKPVTRTLNTIGYARKNKLLGYHIDFSFFYDRYTPPLVLDQLKIIVDYWINKDLYSDLQIILFPRLDILDRYFPVYPSEETIRIAIMRGADKAQGNKGVIIKFLTINYVSNLSVSDPNDRTISLLNLTTL